MVKHIVFWRLKESAGGVPAETNAEEIRTRLMALPDVIPEIREFEVGLNFDSSDAAFDVALYSSFASREELLTYQAHPEHVRVKDFIVSVVSDRAVVDYEIG